MENTQVETVPIEVALEQINQMQFPAVVIGDIAWHAEHRFIYTESGWLSQPEE